MEVPAVTGSGVWVLVMDRSARAMTWAVSVELLFAPLVSVVVEATEAVLVMVAPSGVSDRTVAWIRTITGDPAAMVPSESDPDQAGPVEGSHPSPVQYLAPLSWAGSESGRDTFWASEGPPV